MRLSSTDGSRSQRRVWRSVRMCVAGGVAAAVSMAVWWVDPPPVGEALDVAIPGPVATAAESASLAQPDAAPASSAAPAPPSSATSQPPPSVPPEAPTSLPAAVPPTSQEQRRVPSSSPRTSTPRSVTPPTVRLANPPERPALLLAPGDPLAATVLVEARGCRRGVASTGSGVVLGVGLIVTNAHVVAGQTQVTVVDVDGVVRAATVIGFDPVVDLAALAVGGLNEAPLGLSRPAMGEAGRIAGHPGGGTLSTASFVVNELRSLSGTDIYGSSTPPRQVLRGRASVEHGDSGAPLLLADGSVGGIVYAASVDDLGEAWLVTADDVSTFLAAVSARGGRGVGTGDRCLI